MIRKLIVLMGAAAALAACSSAGGTPPTSSVPVPTGTAAPSPRYSFPPYHPTIDSANFSTAITNPYMPFTPGTTAVYTGTRDGIPLRIEVTVTTDTKTIMGVQCIVVRDIVTGALEERTTDWYAQDTAGNVWYFGEDTKELKNGAVTSTAGSWEAGIDGALPGIVMPAHPTPDGPYREEYRPGVAEDVAKVLRADASVKTPAGAYHNVVVTENTDQLDVAKLEHKFYASGVGIVALNGVVNGHHEVVQLSTLLATK
ncbi:MAG: hypothetical protein M3Q23_15230 [Actinomycetota bacterium]|nr:hypothetical protein [Actinomycetota bacterium]